MPYMGFSHGYEGSCRETKTAEILTVNDNTCSPEMLGFPGTAGKGHPLAAVWKPKRAPWCYSHVSPSWGLEELEDSVSPATWH